MDSSTQTVADALDRIERLNPTLNAFISIAPDARERADERTAETRAGVSRGPLHGLPISVKDLIDVQGMATTAASRLRKDHIAAADAPIVTRLRDAGAVIVGKCNLHEFASGTTNEESAYGPARNPWDPTRSTGGSSGGSGAAVAACMGWASIGTDTGGSIRIPASACGVVGLKPSFGEITTVGVAPLSPSLDHVGPLTRSVSDAWVLYDVLRGAESSRTAAASLAGLRLGVLRGYFLDRVDEELLAQFDAALDRLRAAGVQIVDRTISHAADAQQVYIAVALAEAYAVHARTLASAPNDYSPGVRARLESGRDVSAADYAAAQGHRAVLGRSVDAALAECDALVLPTLPIAAPLIGATTVRIGAVDEPLRPMMLRLTQLFNLTGHPAISIPCGATPAGPKGLPCGLQLVGRVKETPALLGVALGCEPHIVVPRLPCSGY